MRHRLIGLTLAGLALLVQPAPATVARGGKLFLWKATSPTTEVYLLGSIHLGKKEWYPLAKEIEGAFEKSKYLVLEADPAKADQQKLGQLVFQHGVYVGDDSLAKHVPAETLKATQDLAASLGIPPGQIEKMKPWYAAMTLSVISIMKLDYSAEYGIDRQFAARAKDQGKEVLQLESMEFQIKLLAGFPDDLQAKYLAATVEESGKSKEQMEKMVDSWRNGDVATFEKETIARPREKHPELVEFHKKMIDDRNDEMAKKVEGYLKTKDVHFVVAGAAHLVGEKGIVKLLEKAGYKVEQLEAK
jgi:uncharacterized protein YbaP (TraB family)